MSEFPNARNELVTVAVNALRAFSDTIKGTRMINEVRASSTGAGFVVCMKDGTEVHFDTIEL